MIKNMYQPDKNEEEIEDIEEESGQNYEGMNDPYKTLVDLKTDDLVKEQEEIKINEYQNWIKK
jgi:hypothetical protein